MTRKGKREVLLILLLLLWTPAVAVGAQETRLSGLAQAADGGNLQGVVAIETGRLYSKRYRYGGAIDADGWFSVPVPKGGDYAVHIYASGYIYHPVGLTVEQGKNNRFIFKVPPNPAAERAPVVSRVRFTPDSEKADRVAISLYVADPDGNLSHQVLAVNTATFESFLLSPERRVYPWTKNYPDGLYSRSYDTGGRPLEPAEWLFVAADNRCYNSPVLRHPFTGSAAVVPARPKGTQPVAGGPADAEPTVAVGQKVFEENCAVCHYAGSTREKVGPGLKGLFKRRLTPVEKLPVTRENIARRIEKGGEYMPPYAHIQGAALAALILYLQSL